MTDRNPHTHPAPGDRWQDTLNGSIREVYDVRRKGNSDKGPMLVYFLTARNWEGKKLYRKVEVRDEETGKLVKKSFPAGQDKARTPTRFKRVTVQGWTQWSIRPGVKFGGTGEVRSKPVRFTFGMEPAHKAFPKEKVA